MNIRSILLPLLIGTAIVINSGCASVTGTTIQSVSVQTRSQDGKEVTGSACELSNNKGKWFITSPGSVTITRSNDDMQVLCNKQGFDPGRAAVVSDTKGSMFGNILLGGGIGAIVDHNTGAAYEYPSLIQVMMGTFTKIETPKVTVDQQTANTPNTSPAEAKSTSPSPPANASTLTASESREDQLRELKRLHDAGLITQEVFVERQRKILE